MARRREGVRERKCGCLYFDYGPPVLCPKHSKKAQDLEERGLRKVVSEQVMSLGHKLGRWSEYESQPGKWTAYCMHCGIIAIVYDLPPPVGDQIVTSWLMDKRCKRSELMVEEEADGEESSDA